MCILIYVSHLELKCLFYSFYAGQYPDFAMWEKQQMVAECSILDQDTLPKDPHETCSWTKGKCCPSLLIEMTLQDLFLVRRGVSFSCSSLIICLAVKDIPQLCPVAIENLILQLLLKTLQLGLPSFPGNHSEFRRLHPTTVPKATEEGATASQSELKHSSEPLALNCPSPLAK